MHKPGIEIDLEKIQILSELRKEENERFRSFLKGHNARKIDLLFHKVNEEVAPKIDCTVCGNCCKNLSPYLTKDDLRNLTTGLNITVEEVVEKHTETDERGISLKHLPCCFLKDNKCTIYPHRPATCASFPHLHKPQTVTRLRAIMGSYSICPIIFNVVEHIKAEMNFE